MAGGEVRNVIVGVIAFTVVVGIICSGISTTRPLWVINSSMTEVGSSSNFTLSNIATVNLHLTSFSYSTNFLSSANNPISGSVKYGTISNTNGSSYLADFKNMLIFTIISITLMFFLLVSILSTLSHRVHKKVAGSVSQIWIGFLFFTALILSVATVSYIGKVPSDAAVSVYNSFPSSAQLSQYWPRYSCDAGSVFIGSFVFYGQFLTCSWVWGKWYYGNGVDTMLIEFSTGDGWYWAFGAFLTYFVGFVVYIWYANSILSDAPQMRKDNEIRRYSEEREIVAPEEEGFKIVDSHAIQEYDDA